MSIIDNLHTSTACGPGSIARKVLKLGSHILSAPISYIINKLFTNGTFPEILKLAKEMYPVHKSGPVEILSNYRPLSLLSNLSKILEKAMHARIYE